MMTSALGTGGANIWTDKELGKAVKLSQADDSTMVLATNGDEIDGFVGAIAIGTVNDGFSHGSVKTEGWQEALIGTHQPDTGGQTPTVVAAKVGDWVVADDQIAFGTAGLPKVKTSATARSGWKIMRILSGTGVVGDKVLLARD
jgi:hypothetical protein